MTISDKLVLLQQDITNARTAVVNKGGQVTASGGSSQLATDIATIPTGGGSGMLEQGINFVDYDGELIESWTFEELANKTSLPDFPDHSNDTWHGLGASLTNGEWNWTLAEIQNWATRSNNVNQNTFLNVGACYEVPTTMPDVCLDNCMRLFLEIDEDDFRFNVALKIKGTAYIQFDDDASTRFTMTGTSSSSYKYSEKKTLSRGYHVVEIGIDKTSASPQWSLSTSSSQYFTVLCNSDRTLNNNTCRYFGAKVKMIHLAKPTGISSIVTNYGFAYCNAEKVNLFNITVGTYTFYYATIKAYIQHKGTTFANQYAFFRCYNLDILSPNSAVTSVSGSEFQYIKGTWFSWGNIYNFSNASNLLTNSYLPRIVIPNSGNTIRLSATGLFTSVMIVREIIFNGDVNITNTSSLFSGNYILENLEFKGNVTISSNLACNTMYSSCNVLPQDKMIIPNSINAASSSSMFNACYNMHEFTIPSGWNQLASNMFQYNGLKKITIHAGVTTLGTYCLAYSYLMEEIKFEGSTPPTAANANWYYLLPTACKILVPAGSLSAYTSATNYPSSATYQYEEWS